MVISAQLATLSELTSTLGTEDLYDLVEIVIVDAYNQQQAHKAARKQ
jgi:hypothetical protein